MLALLPGEVDLTAAQRCREVYKHFSVQTHQPWRSCYWRRLMLSTSPWTDQTSTHTATMTAATINNRPWHRWSSDDFTQHNSSNDV